MSMDRPKDWRELCEAAINEKDPEKLMEIIVELNKALDEHERKWKKKDVETRPTEPPVTVLSTELFSG